jgi:radical SAM superfamily enzyme YgiQ (UPF0313 family)
MSMRIALIYAGTGDRRRDAASGLNMPPLGLPLLAALAPGETEIAVLDDSRRPVDLEQRFDLVGISALTPTAPRAYSLADEFRRRGATVVLGGIHPSMLPDEAAEHADSVVVGEAEKTWPQLIEDFAAGRLQPRYSSDNHAPLEDLPVPRWDLLPRGYHPLRVTMTSRGCPHRCGFCVVSRHFGTALRHRPIDELAAELRRYFPRHHPFFERARRWFPKGSIIPYFTAKRVLYILDDNLLGDPRHARAVFELLREIDVRWIGHASITIANEPELLDLCAASGCVGLNVGFESLDQATLESIGKAFNRVEQYEEAIRAIHDRGIGIFGTFVVGLENDTPETFARTVEFIERNRLEVAIPLILAPLPGTGIHEQFDREGRLIDRDWRNYDSGSVVYRPRGMSTRELFEGQRWAFEQILSLGSIRRRLLRAPRTHPLMYLEVNREMRRACGLIRKAWAPPPDLPPWNGTDTPAE